MLAAATLVGGLAACVPLVVGGGAVVGTMVAIDRRTTGTQVEDEGIELRAVNRIREALGDRAHVPQHRPLAVHLRRGDQQTAALGVLGRHRLEQGRRHRAPDPLLERHDLELELDLVLAVDPGPDVDRLGLRHIVAAVLEDDLGIADGKSVLVGNTTPADERVVVEVVLAGIEE